jgi:hypothetical protein
VTWRTRRPAGHEGRRREVGVNALDLVLGKLQRAIADALPFLLHLGGDRLDAGLVDQDLDACLVLVVAPALQIVDAQDGLQVAQQVCLGQVVADLLGDEGRAALAAADVDGKAEPPSARRFKCRPMSCTWMAARSCARRSRPP